MPFWVPSLWIALALTVAPGHLLPALIGYHALLLAGSLRPSAWHRGKGSFGLWALAFAPVVLGVLALRLPPLPWFPVRVAADLLGRWPGGLRSQWIYALAINAPLEEGFWRGAMRETYPRWSSWQAGAAFSLHHGVAAALLLPWAWVFPAMLTTALAGALWHEMARRSGGIGTTLLSHALSDAAILLLIQRQLS